MESVILHINIVGFCAAVERLRSPDLRNRPLIVAPQRSRSRVWDMCQAAWQEGVQKAMPLARALRRCPGAVVVDPEPDLYHRAMQRCLEQARRFSPRVEQAPGRGHLFLDITGTHRLFGPPPDVGWRLRKALRSDPGLDPVWSVAPNRLLARVAGRLVKPAGEYLVAAGEEAEFLAPLGLELLPGIGRVTCQKLREAGIRTIGQAVRLSRQDLFVLCGREGERLYPCLRGLDPWPVNRESEPARRTVVRIGLSMVEDSNRLQTVRAAVRELSGRAGRRLRYLGLACGSLRLELEYSDRTRSRRTVSARQPVDMDQDLAEMAGRALGAAWRRRVRIRRLTLECDRLVTPVRQLSLFDGINARAQKNKMLDCALDVLHEKYGSAVIRRGLVRACSP